MPANLTPPTDPENFLIRGDLDVLNAFDPAMGTGTIYVRDGGLYVQGLTDLDKTTINTTDGEFAVYGTSRVQFDITNAIEYTAQDDSFFETTAGTLTLQASATTSSGKVNIIADGIGTNSIILNATNAVSGQITLQSAGASTSTDAIRLLATDTGDGNIFLQAAGDYANSNPAIKLEATNATSGQIYLLSASDSITSDSIKLEATGSTGGNILLTAAGSDTSSIKLYSTNAAGKMTLQSDGVSTSTFTVSAPAGGVLVDALKVISIQSTDVINGVKIATVTSGVPVTIGTPTSLTTVVGDFLVNGTTTSVNTEITLVTDNTIVLNAANGELGLDAGVITRRYQTPNSGPTGDVITLNTYVQERGLFQELGHSLPDTVVLALHASNTANFYKGWWIQIMAGPGIGQVRRIKSYDETTKVATLYIDSDNTIQPTLFTDGLDLVTLPDETSSYRLHSSPYIGTFYSESQDEWTFSTLAIPTDPVSTAGVSTAAVQQYQNIKTGAIHSRGKTYRNCEVASFGVQDIKITLHQHTLVVGDKVRLTESSNITAAVADGSYTITSVDSDNIYITLAAAVVTLPAESSITVYIYKDSKISVNVIELADPEYTGITIPGLSTTEDILIPRQSTAFFNITTTSTRGSYMILVSDLNNVDGASAVFTASSSGSGGSVARISSSKGAQNQRLDIKWDTGSKIQIHHAPASGTAGAVYTYRVRIITAF
jgi:hypothetical protein